MLSNLLRVSKELFYFSIVVNVLFVVFLVDSIVRFVSSPSLYPHGYGDSDG